MRGFFDTSNRRAAPDQRIDTLEDYLYEYCNFGCAYFVIERTGERKEKTTHRRRRHKKKKRLHPNSLVPKNLAKALRFVNVRSKQSEKRLSRIFN